MYEVIYHKNPTRNWKAKTANEVLGHYSRFLDPTRSHKQLLKDLRDGVEVKFEDIATAKKLS